jgi:uncharacterized membrane-anchored protein
MRKDKPPKLKISWRDAQAEAHGLSALVAAVAILALLAAVVLLGA